MAEMVGDGSRDFAQLLLECLVIIHRQDEYIGSFFHSKRTGVFGNGVGVGNGEARTERRNPLQGAPDLTACTVARGLGPDIGVPPVVT